MPVDVKIETAQDIQKIVTITTTRQDVDDFDPNENLRSYRKELVDGVTTIVEEALDLTGAVYQGQIDGTTSTESLLTHSLFKTLSQDIRNKWTDWLAGRETPGWKPSTETDAVWVKFWTRYSGGNDSYFAARITLRNTSLESGPPDQTNVGFIDDGWTNIPGVGSVVPTQLNFLLTSARGTQEGNLWRNTYEWTGCSPHLDSGWDEDIYRKPA